MSTFCQQHLVTILYPKFNHLTQNLVSGSETGDTVRGTLVLQAGSRLILPDLNLIRFDHVLK